ncbi:MAG: hypothetical protein WC780_06190 [Lentimicrobiaceae bacterium]
MADVHDQKTRCYNMSRIKGKDTKLDMKVRKFLFSGFRLWLLLSMIGVFNLFRLRGVKKPKLLLLFENAGVGKGYIR